MDTPTLLRLLRKTIDPEKCNVVGVLPRDWLRREDLHRFPSCCIVNTDESHQPGKHWVAFYLQSPSNFEFFDSYGLRPSIYHFDHDWSDPTQYNSIPIQSDYSNTCAHFCLYYLHTRTIGFAMPNIVRSFSSLDLKWNDKLVRKFVSKVGYSKSFVHSTSLPNPSSQVSIVKRFAKPVY